MEGGVYLPTPFQGVQDCNLPSLACSVLHLTPILIGRAGHKLLNGAKTQAQSVGLQWQELIST